MLCPPQDIVNKISESNDRLEGKRSELEALMTRRANVVADFDTLVPDTDPFREPLAKIFHRQGRRRVPCCLGVCVGLCGVGEGIDRSTLEGNGLALLHSPSTAAWQWTLTAAPPGPQPAYETSQSCLVGACAWCPCRKIKRAKKKVSGNEDEDEDDDDDDNGGDGEGDDDDDEEAGEEVGGSRPVASKLCGRAAA